MFAFISRHPISFALAVFLHGVILVASIYSSDTTDNIIKVNLTDAAPEKTQNAVTEMKPMKTFTVDADSVKQKLAEIKKQEAEKLKRQQEVKRQA
ncbi:MAG: protein TolA, partial [Hydrogenovibrio sp.]|nr:protein TolA [Hydrogenovibrio sp.]